MPIEGFKGLKGMGGRLQKFSIFAVKGAREKLPVSHTWYSGFVLSFLYSLSFLLCFLCSLILCFSFNQLDLPDYRTKEELETKLLAAIRETEGFGTH